MQKIDVVWWRVERVVEGENVLSVVEGALSLSVCAFSVTHVRIFLFSEISKRRKRRRWDLCSGGSWLLSDSAASVRIGNEMCRQPHMGI